MALIEQEPIYLSVNEFRKLTKISIHKLSQMTDIPKRSLYRYQRDEKEYSKSVKRYLALIYKSICCENNSQEDSNTEASLD